MYKDIFKNISYPVLLDSIDDLSLFELPPWEFININYDFWKSSFDQANLPNFAPFARMCNDDVVAAFDITNKTGEIYLFNLPLFENAKPYKKLENINLWLKLVFEDSYEYITEYN